MFTLYADNALCANKSDIKSQWELSGLSEKNYKNKTTTKQNFKCGCNNVNSKSLHGRRGYINIVATSAAS